MRIGSAVLFFMFALATGTLRAELAEGVVHPQYLDQGWSEEIRDHFYFAPQGSWLIPYGWFKALERADGEGLFADPDHLQRFGLLPSAGPSALNPDGFPIGIAVSAGGEFALDAINATTAMAETQVGLTCAACHTANIEINGEVLRIDGAPAHFDFDRFYEAMVAAVTATSHDEARLARLAAAVGKARSTADLESFTQQFQTYQVRLAGDAMLRRPTVEAGFGRADALTQIVNSLAVRDQEKPSNFHPVTAPVSFPQLWLAPQLEFVQWNPIAASPIGRNAGQVLGVFGRVDLRSTSLAPYDSSIQLSELFMIEEWLAELAPPRWDEARMGPIDQTLAQTGAALFAANCAGCHNMAPYRMTDPATNVVGKSFIEIGRVDFRAIGTDPAYVNSLIGRQIETNAVTAPLFGGRTVVSATAFFLGTVRATVETAMAKDNLSDAERAAYSGFRFRPGPDGVPVPYLPPSFSDLKASPLAGVWATGPYLHNGSVPTVYEVLSPEAERRTVFWTGGREVDLERLGFESDEGSDRFLFDTALSGNRNSGHLYPPDGLDHDERMAIIEYLKTQ